MSAMVRGGATNAVGTATAPCDRARIGFGRRRRSFSGGRLLRFPLDASAHDRRAHGLLTCFQVGFPVAGALLLLHASLYAWSCFLPAGCLYLLEGRGQHWP